MKKLFFTLVALALVVGASAQKKSITTMGFKMGINVSNISHIHENYKPSILIGFYTEYKLSNIFAIQPEVVYSKQGSMKTIDGVEMRLRANYLNIPVMAKLFVTPRLSFDLGPQLGINLGTKVKMDNGKNDSAIAIISNDHYNTFEFGVGFGMSYQRKRGPVITARYNMGITDVFKKAYVDKSTRNSVFQIAFGWTY